MDNLWDKLPKIIAQWRETHNDYETSDTDILKEYLAAIGIDLGARVEVINNKKSGKNGEVTIRMTFKPEKQKGRDGNKRLK